MKSKALDGFITERWTDAVEFVSAFHDLEERAMTMFEEEAGPKVHEWLAGKGYELEIDPKYVEYRTFRKDWKNDEQEPEAVFVVGGLFPTGFGKVDCLHPYLWVYLKTDRETRIRQAEELRKGVSAGSEWLHPETNPRQPLGRYLVDIQQSDRVTYMRDSSALIQCVLQRLPMLLELEERVDKALAVR